MLNETHSLLKEFPQYKDRIHTLKMENAHFAKLLLAYEQVDKELHAIETEVETPSDTYTENLKKQRLHYKDELLSILKSQKVA